MRAVVFDLDGTLVDSAPDIAWGINRMLDEQGLPPIPVREVEKLTGEGASVLVERALARAGVIADEARSRATPISTSHITGHVRASIRSCLPMRGS